MSLDGSSLSAEASSARCTRCSPGGTGTQSPSWSGRRAGPELALALRARELWAEIADGAPGTGFRPAGSLTIATAEAELAVMREAAALPDAKQREFELL